MNSSFLHSLLLGGLLLSHGSDAFSVGLNQRTTSTTTRLNSSYMDSLSGAAPLDISTSTAPNGAGVASSSVTSAAPSTDFEYVPKLSLDQADAIANNAIACCQRNGFNPVTVFVLDAWGSTIVMKRMDGCSPVGSEDFARAKAYSCVINKYPSRNFRDRYTSDEASAKFGQMLGMVSISQGQMAPFPGGIVLKLGDHIIGSVGVSGAAGDEDEYCAIRGVVESNLGLTTIPENHSCGTVKDLF